MCCNPSESLGYWYFLSVRLAVACSYIWLLVEPGGVLKIYLLCLADHPVLGYGFCNVLWFLCQDTRFAALVTCAFTSPVAKVRSVFSSSLLPLHFSLKFRLNQETTCWY
jgi:hypothetical protein